MRSTRRSSEPSRLFLLFDLAPDGGCLAAFVTKAPVVSYTTFSPLHLRAVCLCGPIHDLTTIQGLPGILLCGVRTFLTVKRAHLTDLSDLRIAECGGKVKQMLCRVVGCLGEVKVSLKVYLLLVIPDSFWQPVNIHRSMYRVGVHDCFSCDFLYFPGCKIN